MKRVLSTCLMALLLLFLFPGHPPSATGQILGQASRVAKRKTIHAQPHNIYAFALHLQAGLRIPAPEYSTLRLGSRGISAQKKPHQIQD